MKKLIAVLICGAMFVSCKKDKSTYTPDCSGTAKSYVTDVSPLFSSKCNGAILIIPLIRVFLPTNRLFAAALFQEACQRVVH
jgi:hypothetical protein